jgi:cell wall assembly regulator SMI1
MPPSAIDEIRRAQAVPLPGPGGWGVTRRRDASLEAEAGLSPDEIAALEEELGVPVPGELRALLAETSGIDGVLDVIDFTGRSLDVELSDVFPAGLPIAGDGFGNFWVLDVTPRDAELAPIFFACHDPPVVLYQSPNLGEFLHELFAMYVPPHVSAVDDVHEDRRFEVWRKNPGVVDHATALAGDESLRTFAVACGERYEFVDLRAPEIGMGFSWGRYGPRTDVRRHGDERLFAYARPEQKPGLLRRLFG